MTCPQCGEKAEAEFVDIGVGSQQCTPYGCPACGWVDVLDVQPSIVMKDIPADDGPLLASEALYGFAGWLTSRDEMTVMSATDDAAPIAQLVDRFCKANKLAEPRNGWSRRLVHPTEQE